MSRLLVFLLLSGLSAPAYARTMQQRMDAACAAEVQKLCPDAAGDPEQLKACMLKKRALVSTACMKLIDASE